MNILVTIDANYADKLIVMLNSLSKSNPSESLDVYIAHSSLTLNDLACISKEIESRLITIHPIKIPDKLFENAHFTKRISKETYYRLLLFEYLPFDVKRILYLDPDIIVLNSVKRLYNIEFGENIFAGAGHTYGAVRVFNRMRLNMPRESEYINAGVLMINVENMRSYITADEIFSFIDKKGKLLFQADQDVINSLFSNKILALNPCCYNLDEHTYKRNNLNIQWVVKNCVFVHYDGKNEPWKENYKGKLGVFWNEESKTECKVRSAAAAC
ncbi:MAG: glycosyltransferase family 8 protein [Clostridiales bacterium]|nr:glycosyltransferase family 8 protein [Clostridiales bacterium]